MLFLNKEILIKDENKNDFKIIYSVLKNEEFYSYDFKIETVLSNKKDDFILIKGVTNNNIIAKDIFNKLVYFQVTPTTLIDILDDYFNEV